MVLSLDQEQELLRGGPKRVDCLPEDFRWLRLPVRVERPRDVFNPSVLGVRLVPGRRILSNAIPVPRPRDLRRHPIDLRTRNATPLRSGCCVRASTTPQFLLSPGFWLLYHSLTP
jgi:hypothetical protein